MRTLHVGPDEILVAAKVAVSGELSTSETISVINHAETAIRAVMAKKCLVYLEPDIFRPELVDMPELGQPQAPGHHS